jgi:hypothetical protein
LIGVSIAASYDVTLARENGQSENASISTQVVNRETGDEQGNESESDNVTANITLANHDGESENEGRSGNITAPGDIGKRENDNRDGETRGSRSRQPVPPLVPPTPPPSSNSTLVSYSAVIQPILNQRCNSCHPKPGVNLSNYSGTKAAVSRLPGMGQGYLTSAELQKLLTWIQQGALNN